MEKNEKHLIYCSVDHYVVTAEGKVPYLPTEEEKEKFVRSVRLGVNPDAEVVYIDQNPANQAEAFWRFTGEPSQNPLRKPEKPLTDTEVNLFTLDSSDLLLVKSLKNKYVKMQSYETASILRDIEKDMIMKIEYANLKREQEQKNKVDENVKHANDFGDFLLKNFTACHWYSDTDPQTKIFGYTKNTDPTKQYTTEDVYKIFVLNQLKESMEKSKQDLYK